MSEIPRADECPPQARPISFGWSQRRVGNTDVIRLSGELDRDMAAEMRGSLLSAAGSSTAGTIVLDLSELAFVDAGGIRLIMKLCGVATSDGRELRVDGLHGMPEKVFDILGFPRPRPGKPNPTTERRSGDRRRGRAARPPVKDPRPPLGVIIDRLPHRSTGPYDGRPVIVHRRPA